MPECSDLAPFGLFEFGSDETDAEKIYRALTSSVRDAFDVSVGTHVEASCYARALAIAAVRATMRHGHDQKHPMRAVEMLPALERAYQVVPTPDQSDEERRLAVAARKIISRGSKRSALVAALASLIGDNFVGVRTLMASEAEQWPVSPENVGAWGDPVVPSRSFTLTRSITTTGSPVTFGYEPIGEDEGARILAGERYAVGVENSCLCEAVDIVSANPATKQATATFTKAKDSGSAVLSHAPMVLGTQRTLLIIVTGGASVDTVLRKRIDDLLRRVARAVTRWEVYEAFSSIAGGEEVWTAGAFLVGVTKLGSAPVGSPLPI